MNEINNRYNNDEKQLMSVALNGYCSVCGAELPKRAAFCAKCGTRLRAEDYPEEAVKRGRGVVWLSLLVVLAVVAMSVVGFLSSFIEIHFMDFLDSELSGLEIIKMMFKGISQETNSLYLPMRTEIYVVGGMYIFLLLVALITILYTLARIGEYNEEHSKIIFVLNSVTAIVSLGIMIVFFVLREDFVEEGLEEFMKTHSFTIAMAIVHAVLAIISFLMYNRYSNAQSRSLSHATENREYERDRGNNYYVASSNYHSAPYQSDASSNYHSAPYQSDASSNYHSAPYQSDTSSNYHSAPYQGGTPNNYHNAPYQNSAMTAKDDNDDQKLTLGRAAFWLSLVAMLTVLGMSIGSLFASFAEVSLSFGGETETLFKLNSIDCIKLLFKGISLESNFEYYFIRKEIYAAAILYLGLLVVCFCALIFMLASIGDYNKKHAENVAVINTIAALLSVALMIVFLLIKPKFVEDGMEEFLNTQSFTIVLAIVNIFMAISSIVLRVNYRRNQESIGRNKEQGILGIFVFLYSLLTGLFAGIIAAILLAYIKPSTFGEFLWLDMFDEFGMFGEVKTTIMLLAGAGAVMIIPLFYRVAKLFNRRTNNEMHLRSFKKVFTAGYLFDFIAVGLIIFALIKLPSEDGMKIFYEPIKDFIYFMIACSFAPIVIFMIEYYVRKVSSRTGCSAQKVPMDTLEKVYKRVWIGFIFSILIIGVMVYFSITESFGAQEIDLAEKFVSVFIPRL